MAELGNPGQAFDELGQTHGRERPSRLCQRKKEVVPMGQQHGPGRETRGDSFG